MSEHSEGLKIRGTVVAELFRPGTDILVEREIGENIICKGGADAIANALSSGTMTIFNYMVTSTNATAAARATTAIPATRYISAVITPSVVIDATTSKIVYVYTFPAAAGFGATAKFGMESATPSGGALWNEYVFAVTKDNANNDLKITYTVSIAP